MTISIRGLVCYNLFVVVFFRPVRLIFKIEKLIVQIMCFSGNSRWVNSMDWSGSEDFKKAPTKSFLVDDKEAGLITNYGPLSFLKVKCTLSSSLISLYKYINFFLWSLLFCLTGS